MSDHHECPTCGKTWECKLQQDGNLCGQAVKVMCLKCCGVER